MEPSEKNASVSSIQIVEDPIGSHCQIHGKGTPLLLLHDFTGPDHCWAGLVQSLSEYGCVYQTTLPGFLKDDPSSLISSKHYLNFLTHSYDYFHFKKIFLIGFGIGCVPILQFASQNSEKISGLVLINPIGFRDSSGFQRFKKRKLSRILDDLAILTPQVQDNESILTLKRMIDDNKLRPVMEKSLDQLSMSRKLIVRNVDKITAPVLMVAGEDNPIVPLKDIHYLEGHLRSVELKQVKNGKHFFDSETVTVLSEIMIKFFKTHHSDTIHKTVF